MKKLYFVLLSALVIFSCTKKHDCPNMNSGAFFDGAFYRGPDMRAEADYLIVDGVNKGQLTQAGPPTDCTTTGLIHVKLSMGTHTIGIKMGENTTNYTFVIGSSGVTVNGSGIPLQSCNHGRSFIFEDL